MSEQHSTGSSIFLTKLRAEAQQQVKLNTTRILPAQVDWLTSCIGRYPWQVLAVTSGLISLSFELAKVWLL